MQSTAANWILAAVLLAPGAAAAQIYRCDNADGLRYSDQRCGDDAERLEGASRHRSTMERYSFQSPPIDEKTRAPRARAWRKPVRDATNQPPSIEVNTTPTIDCPADDAIEQAIRRKSIALCMSPAQVRRATPPRISNHEVRQDFDQFGNFTVWRYPVVSDGWPVRVQFRDEKVVGFETLPTRARD